MNYQPKGSMCVNCADAQEDCSDIDFSKMVVNFSDQNTTIVICKMYQNKNSNAITKRVNKK